MTDTPKPVYVKLPPPGGKDIDLRAVERDYGISPIAAILPTLRAENDELRKDVEAIRSSPPTAPGDHHG